jgi:hypothetical protein
MSFNEAIMAKSALMDEFLSQPNVVGFGVGYKQQGGRETDELSVIVMVQNKLPPISLSPVELIPPIMAGVRTDVVEVGIIRALEARTDRIRPVPGGVSIGHYQITAGTLGCMVHDQSSGARLILSNNHVLANRNDAHPGDPILQPGPADGGSAETDTIALLERFETIYYNEEPAACAIANTYARIGNTFARWLGSKHRLTVHQYQPYASNLIDAAVARPIIEDNQLLDEILEIGSVSESTEAVLGMGVMKSGRTTAFTSGTINILDATVTVNYGGDRTAVFDHQIVSTPMSQGGDSGSLLVTSETKKAVGLLFAGSSQATLYNPIQSVLKIMRVDFEVTGAKNLSKRRAVLEKAQAVKEAYQYILMSKANVVGVGIGPIEKEGQRTGEIGLIVFVQQKLPEFMLAPEDRIPDEIEGVPVEVREVGEFTAQ